MEPVSAHPHSIGQELRYRSAKVARVLGLYRALTGGRIPAPPTVPEESHWPSDPWPGDPNKGSAIVSGRYPFAGISRTISGSPWQKVEAPSLWHRHAHGFEWLRDLVASGGVEASATARRLLHGWIEHEVAGAFRHEPVAWAPGPCGRRLTAWLYHWPMLSDGASDGDLDALLDSVGRHMRHLFLIAGVEGDGTDRHAAILALIHGCLMIPDFLPRLQAAVRLLEREMSYSILPDGCHATRSPRVQFEILRDLTALRGVFEDLDTNVPIALSTAIDRVAPIVRLFRHGDGRFALFHDTREGDAEEIDRVLKRADAKGRAPLRSPHGGYERLVSGKLCVIADVGAPPAAPFDSCIHAAPLALEVSFGMERLIVNCGAAPGSDGDWARAQRSTAAHSTLSVENTNADEIDHHGRIGKRRASTVVERNENDDAIWIDMSHDGYKRPFGLVHRRRLYLTSEGADLRGEDSLEGEEGHIFALRFHLHPKVQVSLLSNHSSALLKTPSGAGWRLRASGADLSLTESVYLGGPQDTKRTQQILLTGVTGPEGATVKWALQREGKR